ncbi:hypothetical protein [Lentzea sp.]|uniref:hypothetical protein n=1 Tax=Lentzea sp. TaxID=56099 RepID=UPI002B8D2E3C|nr:hypothetical protein [Lentzea sp.]HUQ58861.1 hypothetical protein [Lentzea sp.]
MRIVSLLPAATDVVAEPGLAETWVVDGPSCFTRPGPRVVRGVEVLAHVLHGVGPAPDQGEAVKLAPWT